MFILSIVRSRCVVLRLKFMHNIVVINLQIIVFKFIYNQRSSLLAKDQSK